MAEPELLKRLERYERRTSFPNLLLVLLFLAAFSVPFFTEDRPVRELANVISTTIWAVFAIDYVIRVYLAENRWHWISRHPIELLMVVLPLLRPLQFLRALPFIVQVVRGVQGTFAAKSLAMISTALVMVVVPASLIVYHLEHTSEGATIKTAGDAVWWALTTVTTVGYGDTYPITEGGRIMTIIVMLAGVSFLGVLTAAFAAWFVGEEERGSIDAQHAERLLARIDELERKIDRLSEGRSTSGD